MKDWNKPAFPTGETESNWAKEGMTLLDYFAGQALIGLLNTNIAAYYNIHAIDLPKYSYSLAKAMIEERAKVIAELEKKNQSK